ncbi:MAG: NAD(P)-binding domain-containing protein, partial [Pseudonocardia sediminis]
MTRIAVLGGGRIGEALLSGLLAAGHGADGLVFTERYPERAAELSEKLGIVAAPLAEAVAGAGTVVVAVKPQDIAPLLTDVAASLEPGALVVSLCAGLPTSLFEGGLPDGTPV